MESARVLPNRKRVSATSVSGRSLSTGFDQPIYVTLPSKILLVDCKSGPIYCLSNIQPERDVDQ